MLPPSPSSCPSALRWSCRRGRPRQWCCPGLGTAAKSVHRGARRYRRRQYAEPLAVKWFLLAWCCHRAGYRRCCIAGKGCGASPRGRAWRHRDGAAGLRQPRCCSTGSAAKFAVSTVVKGHSPGAPSVPSPTIARVNSRDGRRSRRAPTREAERIIVLRLQLVRRPQAMHR